MYSRTLCQTVSRVKNTSISTRKVQVEKPLQCRTIFQASRPIRQQTRPRDRDIPGKETWKEADEKYNISEKVTANYGLISSFIIVTRQRKRKKLPRKRRQVLLKALQRRFVLGNALPAKSYFTLGTRIQGKGGKCC
jgi:hypothetical protein